MIDAWRFAIGTFTRIPVRPPTRVTGLGIALAPLVALLIALPLALIGQWAMSVAPAWLVALGVLAVWVWINRALHLDGLADTADALGSGQIAAQALAIARKSDIGPMGVLTLVFVLLAQVASLAQLQQTFIAAVLVAAVTSRVVLVVSCTRIFPAARPDGLGAAVAGSVALPIAWLWLLLLAAGTAGYGWWAMNAAVPIAAAIGLAAGMVLTLIARRRLGGITGDTLGAGIEIAFTASLVAMAVSAG